MCFGDLFRGTLGLRCGVLVLVVGFSALGLGLAGFGAGLGGGWFGDGFACGFGCFLFTCCFRCLAGKGPDCVVLWLV